MASSQQSTNNNVSDDVREMEDNSWASNMLATHQSSAAATSSALWSSSSAQIPSVFAPNWSNTPNSSELAWQHGSPATWSSAVDAQKALAAVIVGAFPSDTDASSSFLQDGVYMSPVDSDSDSDCMDDLSNMTVNYSHASSAEDSNTRGKVEGEEEVTMDSDMPELDMEVNMFANPLDGHAANHPAQYRLYENVQHTSGLLHNAVKRQRITGDALLCDGSDMGWLAASPADVGSMMLAIFGREALYMVSFRTHVVGLCISQCVCVFMYATLAIMMPPMLSHIECVAFSPPPSSSSQAVRAL